MAAYRLSSCLSRRGVAIALAASAAACGDHATGPRLGAAARLVLTAGPHSTSAGVRLDPAISVAIQDSAGRTVSDARGTVTLSIASGSGTFGAHLRGTNSAPAVNGVATFAGLSIDSAGTGYRIAASAAMISPDTSFGFDIAPGPALRLSFPSLPSAVVAGAPLGAPFRVLVLDSVGNVATSSTGPVTLFVVGSGSLDGTTTQNAVAGVATFATASLIDPGTRVIAASAAGLDGAVSGPVTVRLAALAVSAGLAHTCILAPGNLAFCWGEDTYGEIGDGATIGSGIGQVRPPTRVPGLRFASVQAGYAGTCGLTPAGQAYCWGLNQPYGQSATSTPAAVPGASGLQNLSYGTHGCGLLPTGAAVCWGHNSYGELGVGTYDAGSASPLPVAGGHVFESVSAGNAQSCGVTTAHQAMCWGYDNWGSLGSGSPGRSSPTPSGVVGGLSWRAVSTSGLTTCGVTLDGTAYCWGYNPDGNLGNGTTDSTAVPVAVSGGLSFASVSAGEYHACGLTAAGAAYCWGNNVFGQLGNGTTTGSAVPVPVSGGLAFSAIATGAMYTCGLTAGGIVYCWGDNRLGELGYSGPSAQVPTKVLGF